MYCRYSHINGFCNGPVVILFRNDVVTFKLPRMKNKLFMPWFPLSQRNEQWCGKLREDLDNDTQIHLWPSPYGDFWTLDELYKYEALPPEETNEW